MQIPLSTVPLSVADYGVAAAALLAVVAGACLATGMLEVPRRTSLGVAAIAVGTAVLVVRLFTTIRRLRIVTARLSALTRAEILGIAAWCADGSLIDANDAFLCMIGESRDRAAAGLISRHTIAGAEGAPLDPQAARAGFVERTIVGADGTERSIAWGVSELPGDEVLTFAVDVTDRVAADRALRAAREVLEARVRDLERRDEARQAEDAEEIAGNRSDERSLVVLAEKLATANAELEAFSYSVAHDLRAPLRTIDGFSRELLATFAGQLGEQGQHYLNRIRAGTQRMGSLIEALLELSRVSRVDVRRQTTDVSAVAVSVADEQKSRVAPHAEVAIAGGLTASADPRLLRVVLENLLGNALKFSAKKDAPRVELFDVPGQPVATFCVRDNGAGFDMRYADKLFAPFQRLHSPAHFEGTGIGLALVHRAIARHGGTVWVESEPDRGTSIFFTLQPAGSPRSAENPA